MSYPTNWHQYLTLSATVLPLHHSYHSQRSKLVAVLATLRRMQEVPSQEATLTLELDMLTKSVESSLELWETIERIARKWEALAKDEEW